MEWAVSTGLLRSLLTYAMSAIGLTNNVQVRQLRNRQAITFTQV